MELWKEGSLRDFTTEELVKLIKALFADSSLRTRNINILNAWTLHHTVSGKASVQVEFTD
jgi:histone acetyltransferase (RNA polymerase elongator complex component)